MSPTAQLVLWSGVMLLILAVATERLWQRRMSGWLGRLRAMPWPDRLELVRRRPWRWYLVGWPVAVVRMHWTWRRLCENAGLAVLRRRHRKGIVVNDMVVHGRALHPLSPRLGLPRVTRTGLTVRVYLQPGQTPGQFIGAADAMAHAWRMHAVRVVSPKRGEVLVTALAGDPLASGAGARAGKLAVRSLLSARVGWFEDGGPWVVDLRRVPHWLLIGATRSGKSNWLAAFVGELAPQPVALVGIDCKGGMELALVAPRLSALAVNPAEASVLLGWLVTEAEHRMAECRAAGVRSVWDLPAGVRPVPVVCVVDEIAELYLTDGSRDSRQWAVECSTALLRLAQLGAALGLHLVVAGQRVGSELGPGVTALRAQLGGRVCHAVHDEATAQMALGDLAPDAVVAVQTITADDQGTAVTTVGGSWLLGRSTLVTADESRLTAKRYAHLAPDLGFKRPGGGVTA